MSRFSVPWFLWLAATCGRLHAQSTEGIPTTLAATPQVFHSIALIYREFRTEFVGCLYGEQVADTLHLNLMIPADLRPAESFRWGTGPSTCVFTDRFLGSLHTHPSGMCQQPSILDRDRRCAPGDEIVNQCQQGPADDGVFSASGQRFHVLVCGLGELLLYDRRTPSRLVEAVNNGKTQQRDPVLRCHYNIDLPEPRCSPPGTGL